MALENSHTEDSLNDPMAQHKPHHTESLETCIRLRHSIRFYKADPVPEDLLHECLALSQLAPSNSNIQNWRIALAMGPARDRIVAAVQGAAAAAPPAVTPLPEHYRHFRSEFGHLLYGEQGYNIGRSERERQRWATQRNFEFFGAPVVACLTMDAALTPVDALSVGMFVQTFMLALTERGLGSCLQVSVAGYPDVLKREFDLPAEQMVLCGMAIGWPADNNRVNQMVVPREDLAHAVRFLKE